MTPEEFFAGHRLALAVFERVRSIVEAFGPIDIRTSQSQVAFRRQRDFAYLWMPGQYLAKADAEVVLSIPLGRRDDSPRSKEVVRPARARWMHHLEIHDVRDVDAEVRAWLREAADRAG